MSEFLASLLTSSLLLHSYRFYKAKFMEFKLISDTHFEFFPSDGAVLGFIDQRLCDAQSAESVLLLAGDIHQRSKLNWVLKEFACRFAQVVCVVGNHELYGTSCEELKVQLAALSVPNLHVLNPGVIEFVKMGSSLPLAFPLSPIDTSQHPPQL